MKAELLPLPALSGPKARALVFGVAVLCFANSYDGDFVFDDAEAIVNNRDVTQDSSDVFKHDFWGSDVASNSSHKSYRPLTTLSFRANFLLSGLDTKSYHIVNIILHAVVSALSYDFTRIVLGQFSEGNSEKAALLSALLFSIHPVHTECVANVVGRAELLSAVFYLGAFLCYTWQMGRKDSNFIFTILCPVLAFLSMLCKEQGITVLALCLLFDLLQTKWKIVDVKNAISRCLGDFRNNNSCQKTESYEFLTKEVLPLVKRCFILSVCGLLMVLVRFWIMGFSAPSFTALDNPASFQKSWIIRTVNYNYLYALNLWLLVNPSELCFDYSMGCIPLILEFWNPRLLAVFAFWSIFIFGTICVIRMENWKTKRLLIFAFGAVVLPFLPASNLLFRVGFVLAERILYLPSLGYCMAVTVALVHCAARLTAYNKQFKYLLYILLLLYATKSMIRSVEWRTEEKLFASGARVCPGNAKVHYNLAKVLSDAGQQKDAEIQYRHALQLHPGYEQAMNNLANLLEHKGSFYEAEKLLLEAVRIRPDFTAAWMNLGIVQTALRKYSSAENAYLTALRYRNPYPDCYFNLGNLYLSQNRYSEALSAWANATQQKPTHSKAWTNQIILLDNQGLHNEAIRTSVHALGFVPGESSIHFSLASSLAKIGRLEEAENHFLAAIRLEPTNGNYYGNLGVLYHRWQKRPEAEAMYLKALKLDPALKTIENNLNMLRNNSDDRNRRR